MYFITSNKNKIREAAEILNIPMEPLPLELEEVQSISVMQVVMAKIESAKKQEPSKEFIVEDSGLYLGESREIGALIKFFPNDRIVKAYKGEKALAQCCIGLSKGNTIIGETEGVIVEARGINGFGWDAIFQPEGYSKTFAEMTAEEKNKISPRKKALEALKKLL